MQISIRLLLLLLLKWTDRGIAFIIYVVGISFFQTNLHHNVLVLFLGPHMWFPVLVEVIESIFNQPHEPRKQAEVNKEILIQLEMQEDEENGGSHSQIQHLEWFI